MKATLFDIQRFSLHDGPGIRTTVFFKGCSLRCKWCHNPESIDPKPEIQHYLDKCIGCGQCFAACSTGAHHIIDKEMGVPLEEGGTRVFERALCNRCGECAKVCYAGALVRIGEEKTVDEILTTVMRDKPFYKKSGGGMTCSGGEPLLQAGFLSKLLKAAKEKGLHTAVDTAGNVPFSSFEQIIPYTDLFLYDIKAADKALHLEMTGVKNTRIIQNLKDLRAATSGTDARIWIRIPCIPGVAGESAEMERIAGIIKETLEYSGSSGSGGEPLPHTIDMVELLNYHPLGGGKYESLGKYYSQEEIRPLSKDGMQALGEIIKTCGLPVKVS